MSHFPPPQWPSGLALEVCFGGAVCWAALGCAAGAVRAAWVLAGEDAEGETLHMRDCSQLRVRCTILRVNLRSPILIIIGLCASAIPTPHSSTPAEGRASDSTARYR